MDRKRKRLEGPPVDASVAEKAERFVDMICKKFPERWWPGRTQPMLVLRNLETLLEQNKWEQESVYVAAQLAAMWKSMSGKLQRELADAMARMWSADPLTFVAATNPLPTAFCKNTAQQQQEDASAKEAKRKYFYYRMSGEVCGFKMKVDELERRCKMMGEDQHFSLAMYMGLCNEMAKELQTQEDLLEEAFSVAKAKETEQQAPALEE